MHGVPIHGVRIHVSITHRCECFDTEKECVGKGPRSGIGYAVRAGEEYESKNHIDRKIETKHKCKELRPRKRQNQVVEVSEVVPPPAKQRDPTPRDLPRYTRRLVGTLHVLVRFHDSPNVQTPTIKKRVAARQSLCVNKQAKIEQQQ